MNAPNIIKQRDGVNLMDMQEVVEYVQNLEMLLRECPDMPFDHKLRREYRELQLLLEQGTQGLQEQ